MHCETCRQCYNRPCHITFYLEKDYNRTSLCPCMECIIKVTCIVTCQTRKDFWLKISSNFFEKRGY
jgi:hypothetical protein